MLVARSVLRADLSRFACALALVRPSARLDRVAMHDNISVIYDASVHNVKRVIGALRENLRSPNSRMLYRFGICSFKINHCN